MRRRHAPARACCICMPQACRCPLINPHQHSLLLLGLVKLYCLPKGAVVVPRRHLFLLVAQASIEGYAFAACMTCMWNQLADQSQA